MATKRAARKVIEGPVWEPQPVMQQPKKGMLEKFAPVLALLVVVMAFGLGSLWTKLKYLEQQSKAAPAQPTAQGQQPARPQVDLATIKGLFGKDLIKFGDANRKLLLVEVADPSCPYCHAAAGKNPELNKQMGTQFTLVSDGGTYLAPVVEMRKLVDSGDASYVFIYRNGHGNGLLATQALYCAYENDVFWPVHDTLMSNAGYTLINDTVQNNTANIPQLVEFLSGVMNKTTLSDCLTSKKYDAILTRDSRIGDQLGAGGTPGFFVNTSYFAGAYSYTDIKPTVDAALN